MVVAENLVDIPGAEPVAKGVWRVPLRTPTLPPATHTNAFVIAHNYAAIWVEPASCYLDEIARALDVMTRFEAAGLRFTSYFLTHHHADHVGGLSAMSAKRPLPVWAHSITHALVGKVASGRGVDLEEGSLPAPFSDWSAVFTPGHAPGHLCLWRKCDKQLLVGDMVATVGTILIDPEDGDMEAYLRSLALLSELDAQWVHPAHGQPIARERDIFQQYIEHRLAREHKVMGALESRLQTLEQLLPRCYADTPEELWPLAERSLLAHLKKLERENRATNEANTWRCAV